MYFSNLQASAGGGGKGGRGEGFAAPLSVHYPTELKANYLPV